MDDEYLDYLEWCEREDRWDDLEDDHVHEHLASELAAEMSIPF